MAAHLCIDCAAQQCLNAIAVFDDNHIVPWSLARQPTIQEISTQPSWQPKSSPTLMSDTDPGYYPLGMEWRRRREAELELRRRLLYRQYPRGTAIPYQLYKPLADAEWYYHGTFPSPSNDDQ